MARKSKILEEILDLEGFEEKVDDIEILEPDDDSRRKSIRICTA